MAGSHYPPGVSGAEPEIVGGEPRRVYTAVVTDTGIRMGIAVEGETGYYRIRDDADLGGTYESYEKAQAVADRCNEVLGISKEDAFDIVCASMRKPGRV